MFATMDRAHAIELLPSTYALAIRLLDAEADPAAISERLHVNPEALPLLLFLADKKLANLMKD